MDQRELPEILIEMNCHMRFLIEILKRSICLFLRKQMDAEFFQNYKWKMNLPKGFKKSVSPWTSTNNHSLRRQSSARIQKYFCPVAKRHDFFYQTVIDDCSSRFLKQGPNSFKGLIIGWLTLQSRNFQLQARDIHIECSKQFKWNSYFYVSGQSRSFWAAPNLL